MEGNLMKYTNVMKGWQPRWFVLDPSQGMLNYFEKEEFKTAKPRGCVYLVGAVVNPCGDDNQSFIVTGVNAENFKLRAADSKERQIWVDNLRSVAQSHAADLHQYPKVIKHIPVSEESFRGSHTPPSHSVVSVVDQVEDFLDYALRHSKTMFLKIDALPCNHEWPGRVSALDRDVLLLKATSIATLHCLGQCLAMLKNGGVQSSLTCKAKNQSEVQSGVVADRFKTITDGHLNVHGTTCMQTESSADGIEYLTPTEHGQKSSVSSKPGPSAAPKQMEDYTVDQEDGEEEEDVEVEDKSSQDMVENQDQEENKSVIIHLLGQLKLGMDLSKITLPTFILERRSLLEMFADCMAHPDFFLSLPDEKDPEKRLLMVLEWYLTSFHAGRRVDVAKKPYNPIIGETFRCSWLLTPETLSKDGGKLGRGASPPLHLNYIAEQVSHHPPVSAFYFECPEKKLCMNGSIWTKSRFLGMSVGVSLVGKVTLYMLSYGEQYEFGLPSCYARSILSVPWVEMGDKVTLACPQTSLTAYVNFQTKPFYGGKPNKVSAEVKNGKTGKTVCKVSGEWNGVLEFSYSDGSSKAVDTQKLKTWRKRVKPLNKQTEFESRRLWQHVTNALNVGDIKTATEHKRCLEDRQREGENFRKRTGTSFETKCFHLEGTNWVYNNLPASAKKCSSSASA